MKNLTLKKFRLYGILPYSSYRAGLYKISAQAGNNRYIYHDTIPLGTLLLL